MLSLIVFIPLIAAVCILRLAPDNDAGIRGFALGAALLSLVLSLGLLVAFDAADPGMQFVESYSWVSLLNIHYTLGVDGISLLLVVLTTLLSLIAIAYSFGRMKNIRNFIALMLVLETGTLGVFLALDTILFYVFWEVMLIPSYFLIGLWGEGQKVYATTKFVLYTLVGSLLMLVAIVAVSAVHYNITHELSFDIRELARTQIPADMQFWMFFLFFMAFAVKVPVFPLHSWLPHAYVACPIPTLILLTGVMSKTGAYGFIRFCLPLFPDAVAVLGPIVAGAAAIGIVYGAWIAIAQKDVKSLVAYSSISHLGFIVLGIFALNGQGIEGSVLQMVNHGIIAAALFLIVGILEEKMGTRNLESFRGLRDVMPLLYGVFMLVTLAALGLPGLNGFVGEFLILMGVWTSKAIADYAVIYVLMGGLAIVFASIYMLYFFQGVTQEKNDKLPPGLKDIDRDEMRMLLPACFLIVFIGLFPKLFIDRISPAAEHVLTVEKSVKAAGDADAEHH